jgi:antitoxin MazE
MPESNYNGIMKASLAQIPKALLEQTGLRDDLELEVRGSQLVIRAAKHPRAGWKEAFAAMAARGDDALLDETSPTSWDESEWEW